MLADPPSCPPHGKRPVGYPFPTGTLNHSITHVLGARADPRAGRCQVQPLLRSLRSPLHTEGQHGGPHAHTHRTQVISAYRISGRRLDLATGYQRPDTIRPKMQLGTIFRLKPAFGFCSGKGHFLLSSLSRWCKKKSGKIVLKVFFPVEKVFLENL